MRAVRSRIGQQALLVEPLSNVEDLGSAEAQLSACLDLELRQRIRQRHAATLALFFVRGDHAALPADFPAHRLGNGTGEQPSLLIGVSLVLFSYCPICAE